MPHADSEALAADREARHREGARADADANRETMFLILHPERGPRTATGAPRTAGPYWTAESAAEPWEREQGERIDPTPPPEPCPEGRAAVLAEVCAERARQDMLYGGAEHDDRHHLSDWLVILVRHCGLAAWDGSPDDVCHKTEATGKYDPVRYRKELVRVAAVAVAALEAFDRAAAREGDAS